MEQSEAGPSPASAMERHERRKRNRPALSCIQCRSRKIRCDRNEPCASCVKSKILNCAYEEGRRPKPRVWGLTPPRPSVPGHVSAEDPFPRPPVTTAGPAKTEDPYREHTYPRYPVPLAASGPVLPTPSSDRAATGSTLNTAAAPTPSSSYVSGGGDAASAPSLADRVRQLEQQLSEALKYRDSHDARSSVSTDAAPSTLQGSLAKTRYFGQSHWMNMTRFFPVIMNIAERFEKDKDCEEHRQMLKCKNLARNIKLQRVPSQFYVEVGKNIPPKATASELLSAYFRTFETVYRILHVPTFWRDYDKYWDDPSRASPIFVLQLQLCMAIGICFQDNAVALRPSATQWIYEAQFWLVSPPEKARMNIGCLQIRCLLHLAREACGAAGDLTWISAGTLIRTAMFMGLHRDPERLSRMSLFKAELRRRLWASILEIGLQSTIDSGGPPLIALSDFDTRPPSNFDDEQLSDDDQTVPAPRAAHQFTQTTVQITLLRSFAARLGVAQYVNGFRSSSTYDETLRWNSELTAACRSVSAALQPAYDPAGVLPRKLSLFQLRMTEHMMHRFFMALNYPWLVLAQSNPAYYFARKMCVEAALKLCRGFSTSSPTGEAGAANPADDFVRLSTAGSGAFRTVPLQAVMVITLELQWQCLEDRSFRQSIRRDSQPGPSAALPSETDMIGPSVGIGSGVAPRSELIGALRYYTEQTLRRIRAGETNFKGHLFVSGMLVQMEALQRGASDAEVEQAVENEVRDVLKRCWDLLKEMAGEQATPAGMSDDPPTAQNGQADVNMDMLEPDDLGFGFGMEGTLDWEDLIQDPGFSFNLNFGSMGLSGAVES
ncbi:hypothetical protein VTK73DRAFT_7212 [Phialemonium thermophilum]|uniref:Zn(2)-C6 fungal-type domain-containing protein n=1 Tax=Phialemonium thermophilum TaxID=223376 RepID=A0ABR3WG23_9PEZI